MNITRISNLHIGSRESKTKQSKNWKKKNEKKKENATAKKRENFCKINKDKNRKGTDRLLDIG